MEDKKRALKEILKQLHEGLSPETVKERFKQVIESISAEELARVEQEIISEGVSREELRKLCDVHLAIFKDQLQKQQTMEAKPENPVNLLLSEHVALQHRLDKLIELTETIRKANGFEDVKTEISELKRLAGEFLDAEKHYIREENVLFPALERHGITEPPAIMWMEHDKLREDKKQLNNLLENHDKIDFKTFKEKLADVANILRNDLSGHIFKENNILFPTALRVLGDHEWCEIRREFEEIGYCCFTPEEAIRKIVAAEESRAKEAYPSGEDILQLETGTLTKEEVEGILNALPVDITFVDRNDEVKFFNKAEKRIFVRTKSIIGRKVQLCHPQKSVHIVNRILEAFKRGEKEVAEFWINVGDRLVYIRYFPVRDAEGNYLGVLEVTQDITEIRKIEGEKRLLDWKG